MRFIGVLALLFAAQAMAASPDDAKGYVSELDSAIKTAEPALKEGDLKTIHEFSKRMNQLKQVGETFGSSVMDKPYGACFAAGIYAQSWWQAKLDAARTGAESVPGRIANAWKDFQVVRGECLQAAKGSSKGTETEQIASTSEIPPRKGCLKVLGVRSGGQVGTVAYTCSK